MQYCGHFTDQAKEIWDKGIIIYANSIHDTFFKGEILNKGREINESLITRTIENRDSTNYNMTAGNSNYQGND